MSLTIAAAIKWGQQQLPHSDTAKLDSEVLLCHVLNKPKVYLYTWPNRVVSTDFEQQFKMLIEKRQNGHPVAHLTGFRDFWDLTLKVTPDTLIPRPDTEVLVETALVAIENISNPLVLDLGTGTGAIALAIASERPDSRVVAVEKQPDAFQLALENQKLNQLKNVNIRQGNWFSPIKADEKFHLIVTNPPYIDKEDIHLEQGDVRFEPMSALVADDCGLADIRQIAADSLNYLLPKGVLITEHGYEQAVPVTNLFQQYGYTCIKTIQDLAGQDRVTLAKYNQA